MTKEKQLVFMNGSLCDIKICLINGEYKPLEVGKDIR
jgi:hypothetical protein